MGAAEAGYRVSERELGELEREVVEGLRAGDPGRTVACALVVGDSELSGLGRTLETRAFPGYDFEAAMAPYEERSLFLYTVDLDLGCVAHVKRMVRALPDVGGARTGIEVLDDRLHAADPSEQADLDELRRAHAVGDLRRCLNLATNIAVDRGARPTRQRPYSLLSYKAVLEWGLGMGLEHLFAYVNRGAVRSLGRLGVEAELLGGREFHLPDPSGGYDLDYLAVHIDGGERTRRCFSVPDPSRPLTAVVARTELPVVVLVEPELTGVDGTSAVQPVRSTPEARER